MFSPLTSCLFTSSNGRPTWWSFTTSNLILDRRIKVSRTKVNDIEERGYTILLYTINFSISYLISRKSDVVFCFNLLSKSESPTFFKECKPFYIFYHYEQNILYTLLSSYLVHIYTDHITGLGFFFIHKSKFYVYVSNKILGK